MLLKLHIMWHKFGTVYINLLLNSCIDEMYQDKLIKKVSYHQEKIVRLTAGNIPLVAFKGIDKPA